MNWKLPGVLVCVLLIGACASGPRLEEVRSAFPQISPGQARIYFYRPSIMGAMIQPTVVLNGVAAGTTRANGFFFVDVAPGAMQVAISTESEEKLEFAAAASQTRFVRVKVAMGFAVGRFHPELVDETEAEREIAGLSYTGPMPGTSVALNTPSPAPAATTATALAAPAAVSPDAHQTGTGKPLAGAVWTYSFRDRIFSSRDREFSVRALAVDEPNITELLSSGSDQQTVSSNTRDIGFQTRRISGEEFIELSPYLLTKVPAPAVPLPDRPRTYPGSGEAKDWTVRVTQVRREQVAVPAGRFDAYRLNITGESEQALFAANTAQANNQAVNDYRTQRFAYEAWYAPQIGRYVQTRHKTFNKFGREIGDEWIQLKRFEPPAGAPLGKKGG